MTAELVTKLIKALRQPGRVVSYLATTTRDMLLWDRRYARVRDPKVKGVVPHDPEAQARVLVGLRALGFDVVEGDVDLEDHRRWCAAAQYERYHEYGTVGPSAELHEKRLEHYLAARLLDLGPDDVYIDVASYNSPAPDVYARLVGCTTYRQDLIYPRGLRGRRIGGDAGAMPVPAGFATKMALHNSYEHFEGDADVRLLREAARVLRPGGRMCIVPLLLHEHYAVQTDPATHPREGVPFDEDALIYCARGWRNRFGRFYDVAHLVSRVRDHLDGLRLTIHVVRNERQVHPTCYAKFAAVFEKT